MRVSYDKQADAVYIEITEGKADGVIEVKEGINIDVTEEGNILGIELLNASKKISLNSLFTYQISQDLLKASA
ncbi:MAG: DUF2283 domain-containing protein [Bacteroidetes bacterium]|nr:DUF2283 domain-containing protein [Bacteroidota bacterium]